MIPLRREGGEWQVFLIHHAKGGHWGFPKGHAEEGEEPLQTALRELKEETGLDVERVLLKSPLVESYTFYRGRTRVLKTASYFPALVCGELKLQEAEICEGRWLPFNEAKGLITFKESKTVFQRMQEELHAFFQASS